MGMCPQCGGTTGDVLCNDCEGLHYEAEMEQLHARLREQAAEIRRLTALKIVDAAGRQMTQGAFNAFMHDYNHFKQLQDQLTTED